MAEHVLLDLGLDSSTECSYLYWNKADDSLLICIICDNSAS